MLRESKFSACLGWCSYFLQMLLMAYTLHTSKQIKAIYMLIVQSHPISVVCLIPSPFATHQAQEHEMTERPPGAHQRRLEVDAGAFRLLVMSKEVNVFQVNARCSDGRKKCRTQLDAFAACNSFSKPLVIIAESDDLGTVAMVLLRTTGRRPRSTPQQKRCCSNHL